MAVKLFERLSIINVAKAYFYAELHWALPSLVSCAIFIPVLVLVPITQNECTSRQPQECGFEGNSDFYGLGIRIGVYLQWLASLVSFVWVPSQTGPIGAANMAFLLAIFIAMFMATYHSACTFGAEIIIVLYILWGGSMATLTPLTAALNEKNESAQRGLMVMWSIWGTPTIVYTGWFWINMASGSKHLFADTPCGTSFFLLNHVTSKHIQSWSYVVVLISVSVAVGFLATPVLDTTYRKDRSFQTARKCLFWVIFLPVLVIGCILYSIAAIGVRALGLQALYTKTVIAAENGRPGRTYHIPRLNMNSYTVYSAIVGFMILFWTIIAIELTLYWNSVTGIYSLDSSGQLIALIVGLGTFLSLFWELFQKQASRIIC